MPSLPESSTGPVLTCARPDTASARVASDSILQDLRTKTRAQHLALESHADIWSALSSRTAYLDLIRRMYGIYSPLEAQLFAVSGLALVVPDLSKRWKRPWLAQDLRALGASEGPLCTQFPELTSLASALGCLYVLEGSTLGGQMITRELHKRLGLLPETGGQFFFSYGPNVGKMWKAFGQAVELFCVNHPESRAEVVDSAQRTFAAFSQWFRQKR